MQNTLFTQVSQLPGKIKWHLKDSWRKVTDLYTNVFVKQKPVGLPWKDHIEIHSRNVRYQPLVFPGGEVIPQKCAATIPDSRDKLPYLQLPEHLEMKTFMDIGCAEGFFVLQAAFRGAERAVGFDLLPGRIRIARKMARIWKMGQQIQFHQGALYDIPPEWTSDLVTCLAVAHHLHRGTHDTWQVITQPEANSDVYENMLRAVGAVAQLTKEMTIWEYAYEYEGHQPNDVDYTLLGEHWVKHGIYSKVDFIGLAPSSENKDRAIYHAYK